MKYRKIRKSPYEYFKFDKRKFYRVGYGNQLETSCEPTGATLEPEDEIKVRWPNGKITREVVLMREIDCEEDSWFRKAKYYYILVDHNGIEAEIDLTGLEVKVL